MVLNQINDGINEEFKKKVFSSVNILIMNGINVTELQICKNFAKIEILYNNWEGDYITIGYIEKYKKYVLDAGNIGWIDLAIPIFEILNIPSAGLPRHDNYSIYDNHENFIEDPKIYVYRFNIYGKKCAGYKSDMINPIYFIEHQLDVNLSEFELNDY